jgi:hypothetical protein
MSLRLKPNIYLLIMNFSSRSRFLVQINIGRNFVDLISLALLTDGSISKVLLNLGVHSNQRISFSMSNTGEGSLQNRGST